MHSPSDLPPDLPPDVATADVAQAAAALIERLRARAPKVHCITNAVAQNFTANVLLAVGCVPSMTLSPEEIAPFVARADALLVNLGTFDRERREATEIAVETAGQDNVPWVLDPVFIDRAAPRAAFARALVGRGPKVVRLNARRIRRAGRTPSRRPRRLPLMRGSTPPWWRCPARPISSATARGWRASPTAIR